MGSDTCRYRYGERYCAHSAIEGRECLGEEGCSVHAGDRHSIRHHECSNDQWFGLYCAKYQRFFCAGKGNCGSVEQYMTQLNSYRQGQWRS